MPGAIPRLRQSFERPTWRSPTAPVCSGPHAGSAIHCQGGSRAWTSLRRSRRAAPPPAGGSSSSVAAREGPRRADPGFVLAGAQPASPDPGSDAATTAAVRSSRAQVLLLAYGAAAEEAWLARNLEGSGAIIGLGVGGAFDFISGRVRRAPPWMRESGLA